MGTASIAEHFSGLDDPRVDRTLGHDLLSIVAITLCAVICGADGWVGVAAYGRAKEAWLRTWLKLDNGIPSHDTFGRVFAMLDPEEFRQCLTSWMKAVQEVTGGQVCIDGKCVRGSRGGVLGKNAIHMVSAWAAGNHLVLGQVKVDEKSNEIRAIPSLLEVLDLAGCIVSIDAAGCQTKIVEQIVAKKADYVLAVKGNQGQLHEEIANVFAMAERDGYREVAHIYAQTMDASRCGSVGPRVTHLSRLRERAWAVARATQCRHGAKTQAQGRPRRLVRQCGDGLLHHKPGSRC